MRTKMEKGVHRKPNGPITPETGKPGAVLGGTLTVTAAAGIATFPDLTLDRSGEGYRLRARAENMISADSDPFDVDAPELTIVKSALPEIVEPGGDITYTLVYGNAGDGTAAGVVLRDVLP